MGKFLVKKAKGGVMFNLVAGNGEVIATSETYKTLASCKKGIASVQKNAASGIEDLTEKGKEISNPKFQVYKDKKGQFRFRLKAANGQIIAVGEAYKEKEACVNGIASIKKNAPKAAIEEAK